MEDGAPVPDGCQLLGDDGEPLVLSETRTQTRTARRRDDGGVVQPRRRRPATRTTRVPANGAATRSPRRSCRETLQMNREVMGSGGRWREARTVSRFPPNATGRRLTPSYFDVRAARRVA